MRDNTVKALIAYLVISWCMVVGVRIVEVSSEFALRRATAHWHESMKHQEIRRRLLEVEFTLMKTEAELYYYRKRCL